jgi:hypothetical protein
VIVKTIYNFTGHDGAFQYASLTVWNGKLYGTTSGGLGFMGKRI